jgi:hypothetical protein
MAAPKNPGNRWSDKAWREAIRVSVNEEDANGIKKIRRLADQLVALALDGDVGALKEVGDRLDGRPAQALEHSGPDGEALVVTWQPQS